MKLMIVEDEKIIRNGLAKHIDWQGLGIEEVKAAANTEEALSLCGDFAPDIAVSDITMPGENGIELCRKLRLLFPEMEIVFVTGYADKEYLKAAIDLHAVRYVEKPVNRDDIAEAVREAISRRQKTRDNQSARLHKLFIDSVSFPIDAVGKSVFRAGILHLGQPENLLALKGRLTDGLAPWLSKNGVEMLADIADSATLSFLLGAEERIPLSGADRLEFTEMAQALLAQEARWFLSIGAQAAGQERITDSWRSALHAGRALAYRGWNHVMFAEDMRGEHQFRFDRAVLDRFAAALSARDAEGAQKLLSRLVQELQEGQSFLNADVRHVFYSMNLILERALQSMFPGQSLDTPKDTDFLERAETFEELGRILQERLLSLSGRQEAPCGSYVVQQVTDYIAAHYGDSTLSIGTLAAYVGLTPTYLSHLFKKSTGLTIGQHLLDTRVEMAKRLMRDPQLKFYQVASMAGYEDANYFAKIFKKKTNMTPSEYKESLSIR